MHVLSIICDDNWMPENFSEGWRRCGATVTEFLYDKNISRVSYDKASYKNVERINNTILSLAQELHQQNKLTLIFMSIYDDYLLEETLIKLKKLNVPLVNYHPDMVVQWYRMLKTGKYFDFIGCAQKTYLNVYEKKKFKAQYLPFASNPSIQKINIGNINFNGATFMGAPLGYRPFILSHLYFNNIPLRIFGHHWDWVTRKSTSAQTQEIKVQTSGINLGFLKLSDKNIHDIKNYLPLRLKEEGVAFLNEQYYKWKEKLFPTHIDGDEFYGNIPQTVIHGQYKKEDFVQLVNESAINIGFTHLSGKLNSRFETKQVRLREFEVPLAGGFYITQYCNELADLYKEGKHIATWKTRDELLEKTKYYLNNNVERNTIAKQGYEYALANHTWEKRFNYILNELKIKK
ncbi:MAG: glycosyltransferase family 1 protein [Bacteroidetes bacterium]|nr:glycosyltransferase family 1 protein [Bacteroidota bacterium]MBS1649261.1 glycosyltransferase family 1 protein [Bacteroidota bacterium]